MAIVQGTAMPRIFISATQQNVGKTTTSLGLYALFRSRGLRVGFIKPVGQRVVKRDGTTADEDAVLMQHIFRGKVSLADMSPVTIPRGYTREYVFKRDRASLFATIDEAMARVEKNADVVIVEGTGHAGVGSVIDASNADVASHVGAKVVIIAGGGVGRSVDEVCLNKSLFEQAGVPVIGAVVNKVYANRYQEISVAVRQGLHNKGVNCLAVMPFERELTFPTVRQLKRELGLTVVAGEEWLDRRVKSTIVAAMSPQNTLGYIRDGCLVITPGDRVDNILVSIAAHLIGQRKQTGAISAILLTGGIEPDPKVMGLVHDAHVPVLVSDRDTYHAAAAVDRLTVKIGPSDRDKVETAFAMIAEHLDTAAVFAALGL
jgi:dethiobiotin synthase